VPQQPPAHPDALLEAERARIARDLHDELGATLSGIAMHVQMALSAGGSVPVVRERLQHALQLVDAANTSLHRIINALRPSVLDHLGLWGGIEWLAQEWRTRTGLPCELVIDPGLLALPHPLDDERASAVFRIAQESLTNAARHAAASCVTVHAHKTGDALHLTIADDGQGFDPQQRPAGGLSGMRERAHRHGGSLQISSDPGHGTRVTLHLPL
jgi:signal transduction histidine kinase